MIAAPCAAARVASGLACCKLRGDGVAFRGEADQHCKLSRCVVAASRCGHQAATARYLAEAGAKVTIIGPTEPDSHVGYRGLWSRHYDEASLGSSETGRELEALLANCADFGTSGELLHADELATRFPDLSIPADQVGV